MKMTDEHTHNFIVAAILIAVAVVGIGGLYFTTRGTGPVTITGADTFQEGNATFNVSATINLQFKPFTDSNSISANITGNQTTYCMFATAVGNDTANMDFNNGTTAGGLPIPQNLVPTDRGCEVVYETVSEDNQTNGAFGVENLGSIAIRVNASDATGCTFGESAPASCTRQIVANQQFEGACNTTNSSNFCIRTVENPGGPEAVHYVNFQAADSPVILCDYLEIGGGIEIDLNYTYTIAGVSPGPYVDSISFVADNVTDPTCQT